MKKQILSALFAIVFVVVFFGCEKAAAPSLDFSAFDKLVLKSKPDGAIGITEVRSKAKPGDKIVISGEIGGRKNDTFSSNLSTFFLADPNAITNCTKKHAGEGGCPTPWDYCCEAKDKVLSSIALIQLKSPETGKIASKSLKGWNGLKELSQVTVVGTVDAASSSMSLIIDVGGIYIHP